MFENPIDYFTTAAYALYALTTVDFLKQINAKKTSEKYWEKEDLTLKDLQERYDAAGKKLPYVSTLIPARNESVVIKDTIKNMSNLNYPRDRLELSIITDEKEDLEDLDSYLSIQSKTGEKSRTTLEIARKVSEELKQEQGLKVNTLSVPVGFDGYYPGKKIEETVKSTKGRALNYGLNFVSENTDLLGIYDADASPDPDVLLGTANKLLEEPDTVLMQGPIFQVGNHNKIGPFGKFISLYQSMTHEWFYPKILEEGVKFPFIGGTNYFIKPGLAKEIGGFDPASLTEDFDLGARLWFEKDVQAKFIPYIEVSQTPSSYRNYFKQRFRWRSGGLEVYNKMMHSDYPKEKKKKFRNWFLKNEFTIARAELNSLISPIPAIALYALGNRPDSGPLFWAFTSINVPFLAYPAYLKHRYEKYMDSDDNDSTAKKIGKDVELGISSIPFSVGAPQPFFYAGLRHLFGKKSNKWQKTPRTKSNNHETDKIKVSGLEEVLAAKGMDEEYAFRQLTTYFDEPQKTEFYEKAFKGGV